MGNFKDKLVTLIGKKASQGESDEPTSIQADAELTRGAEYLDDPNFLLRLGIPPENAKPYRRQDPWSEQYDEKEDVKEYEANLKQMEEMQLRAGLESRKVSTGPVSKEELEISMGGVPKKYWLKQISHPKEDTENE